MSRVIVYLLDKTVWLLLITIFTTQALQIAGIVETPKGVEKFDSIDNFDHTHQENMIFRIKRDSDASDRSQFIDMLFNPIHNIQRGWTKKLENAVFVFKIFNKIPIKTLTAVNNLIQNSRPALKKLREFASRRFEKTTKAPDVDSNNIQKRSYPVFIRPVGEKN